MKNSGDNLNRRLKKLIDNKRGIKRVERIIAMNEEIKDNQETHNRTEALRLARLVAITSLPVKRTKNRDRSKTLRLGKDLWARITLTAQKGQLLPFGEDRFVLAGVMHLAIQNNNPIVFFKFACDLLKMFEIAQNDQGYKLLRERFQRISGLSITIRYAASEKELDDVRAGENMFVIHRYALPTKREIEEEKNGQPMLTGIVNNPELCDSPYGVKLSSEFWEYLREPQNQLIIPVNLLKLFIDRPMGWDYALFLLARCGAAKSHSKIDHETLIALFKEGKEPDRKTIYRLKQYHEQIMLATAHHLSARIIEDGYFSKDGKGRRQKKWALCVGPSDQIIWSGKKPKFLPISSS